MGSTISMRWSLRLLGSWELRRGTEYVDVSVRQQRFLAALAILGPRSRGYLASLLWPDSSETHAAGSLRTCMFEVSHRLPRLIRSTTAAVALEDDVDVDIDLVRRIIREIHATHDTAMSIDPVDALSDADVLPGWYEDWIDFAREQLAQERLSALETLALSHLERENADLAIRAANAAVAIEPMRESAHLLLVRGHLLAGNYASATSAHQRIKRRLEHELGVAATPQFEELLANARPDIRGATRSSRAPRSRTT